MPLTIALKKSGPKQHLESLEDMLAFGKMKGCTVDEVIHDEPSYMVWLLDNNVITCSTILEDTIRDSATGREYGMNSDIEMLDEIPF